METSQHYEVTTCHSGEKELDWYDQGDEKDYFTERIDEELGSFMNTIDSNNPDGRLKVKYNPGNFKEEIDGFKICHSKQHVNHEA